MARIFCLALLAVVPGGAQVDPATLAGKVLLGYQGWFRCPGGSNGANWSHWASGVPSPATLVIDMYPDLREFSPDELCAVPGMSLGGAPAHLFSSANSKTVDRHFSWMRQYGIDGVLVQRFVTDIPGARAGGDVVLRNVMAAARRHGRAFAIEYDISGANPSSVVGSLQNDWTYLVETAGVPAHPMYLRHEGRPLVGVWGIGLNEARHPPDDPSTALQLIDWFHSREAAYMGGTPAYWRTLSNDSLRDERWAEVYGAMDVIQPWTVGRYATLAAADRWRTSQTAPDLAATSARGQQYMPVVFPGFSWYNLNRTAPQNQIPRARGEFLWRQAYNARAAGAGMLKIAMFDEVNESTAMFKLAARRSDAPDQGYWLTLDADGFTLPSDWYLRLAGEIARGFRGGAQLSETMPANPGPPWGESFAAANAASYSPTAAPEAIATAAGTALPAAGDAEPASLTVIDASGAGRAARVLYAGAAQWNFVVPQGTATGRATLAATASGAGIAYASIEIAAVSPGLFEGAAVVRTVRPDGTQTTAPASAPIELGGPADQVFLELYGTGIRGRSALAAVVCRIGGRDVPVLYAGPHGASEGLDQVNVALPRALAGSGRVFLELTVDGTAANRQPLEFR